MNDLSSTRQQLLPGYYEGQVALWHNHLAIHCILALPWNSTIVRSRPRLDSSLNGNASEATVGCSLRQRVAKAMPTLCITAKSSNLYRKVQFRRINITDAYDSRNTGSKSNISTATHISARIVDLRNLRRYAQQAVHVLAETC